MTTWTCGASNYDGHVQAFYGLCNSQRVEEGGQCGVYGFEDGRVGVESAEVINMVASRELVVTVSDKIVKISGAFRGNRECDFVKIVYGCEGVNGGKTGKGGGKDVHWNRRNEEGESSPAASEMNEKNKRVTGRDS